MKTISCSQLFVGRRRFFWETFGERREGEAEVRIVFEGRNVSAPLTAAAMQIIHPEKGEKKYRSISPPPNGGLFRFISTCDDYPSRKKEEFALSLGQLAVL